MLKKEVSSTIFKDFRMTRPGFEPRSTEPLANTQLTKPIVQAKSETAIDFLSITQKSDDSDEIKPDFFKAIAVLELLYRCSTWTLKKRRKEKLNENHTRMLRAVSNESWKQHHIKQQLYGRLPPISQTTRVRRTRYTGHGWRSKDELIDVVLCTHLDTPAGQRKLTYFSSVRTLDAVEKNCHERYLIWMDSEKVRQLHAVRVT